MNFPHNRIIRIVLFVISLGLSVSAGRTILELWQRKDIIREREGELIELRNTNEALERTLQDIQGDAYVEKIARDKLGMVREGETILIMPESGGNVEGAKVEETGPKWKKWWRLFF